MITLLAVLIAIFVVSCTPNQRIMESSAERSGPSPQSEKPEEVKSSFEKDVESMRTADFVFIYAFRRKDGGPLDTEDRKFASQSIPQEMNRREVSDSGKAIIVGSNFRMPEVNLKVLSERFAFEDLSTNAVKTATPTR